MTSSVHHVVADLAARLDYIEQALKEDWEQYTTAQSEAKEASGSLDLEATSSPSLSARAPTQATPSSSIAACRLNLSQRLASVHSTFSKSIIHGAASEVGDRLSDLSTVLLPSYISSEVAFEPDRLVDAEATAQRYAVIKRRLNGDGQRELEQLKLNMRALCESAFAKDETGAVIADVLSYNGPTAPPATGDEAIGAAADGTEGAPSEAAPSSIREWVDRASENNRRAQELHLRLAKAKARFESLVNYSNKQMCVWDLQIEELEKRARRQAAQKR